MKKRAKLLKHRKKNFFRTGFTLIELLIVIVIIAALAVAVFIALNPVKRLQDARNAKRTTDIESIRNAINQYLVDKDTLPAGLTAGMQETQIGTSNGTGIGANNVSCVNTTGSCNAVSQSCVDLTTPLTSYLKSIPQDPKIGSAAATGYSVSVDTHNNITVNACGTEESASNLSVVFDNQSTTSVLSWGTSFSWNHTTGSGQNRLLVVGITDAGATSVTYNGITLTKLQSQVFSGEYSELWYLINPPSGTHPIIVTTGANGPLAGGASSWSNVNQTTPFGLPVTQTSNVQTVSMNVPSAAGEIVVDNYANSNGADPISVTGGQTTLWNYNQGSCCFDAAATYIAGSPTTTLSYTSQLAATYGWVAAAIKPVGEPTPTPTPTPPPNFISRSGSDLMLHGSKFRFAGSNSHWLGWNDYFSRYTTHSEAQSAFTSVQTMHGNVIRSFAIMPIGTSFSLEPSLNTWNDAAFEPLDYELSIAQSNNIYIILPLVNNWDTGWTQGKSTYTTWEGINDELQFYINPTVIQDFKNHIAHVLNHVNQYTGIAYKNDPNIMAWETGNELNDAPYSWTEQMAEYIKSIDPNHLVLDGLPFNYGGSKVAQLQYEPSVDIYSDHYYPVSVSTMQNDASLAKTYNKAFFVGEYDWHAGETVTGCSSYASCGGDPLSTFLSTIESTPSISGDLYWEMMPFDQDQTDTYYFTLHYPGDNSDMQTRVQQLTQHGINMQ